MNSTQLTNATGYDTSRMIFSDPIPGSIPDSKPAITYKRINISTVYPDGNKGDLVVQTENCYSYGPSENLNQETGKVSGFVMPLVLYSRNGPTDKEKDFVDTFNKIIDKCKDYILENKEELEQFELEPTDLRKLNPLYYKRDKNNKGKIVEGSSPTLYAKLIISKKQGDKIITVFFKKDSDERVDPLELLGKHCYATSAIKFESIFIGNKISIQIKLLDCEVTQIDTGFKRLLSRPEAEIRTGGESVSVPLSLPKATPVKNDEDDEAIDDDAGSLVDDEPPVEETIKTIPKKVVKKIVKKATPAK